MNGKIIAILLILWGGISRAQEVTTKVDTLNLSIDQAFDLMMSNNKNIKASEYNLKSKEYQIKAAKGLRMPKIGLTGIYTMLNDDIAFNLVPVKEMLKGTVAGLQQKAAIPGNEALANELMSVQNIMGTLMQSSLLPNEYLIQNQKFGKANVELVLPIYAGGKINAANKAAQARYNESEFALKETKNKLFTELVARYYGLTLLEQLVIVRKQVVEGIKQHLDNAVKLESNGMISHAERLHAEVAYSAAKRELEKAIYDADIIRSALANTISTKKYVTTNSSLFYIHDIKNVEEYKSIAKINNTTIKKLEAKKLLAEQGVKKEKSNYFPTVFLTGKKELLTKDLTVLDPEWYVGVGVKFNIFDGLARTRKYQSAKMVKKQVDSYCDYAQSGVETLIDKAYKEIKKSQSQIKSLDTDLKFANEYFRVRTKAFKEGFTTSVNVVDAQLNLSKVKIEKLMAVYQFDLALANLCELCGISTDFNKYRTNKNRVEIKYIK